MAVLPLADAGKRSGGTSSYLSNQNLCVYSGRRIGGEMRGTGGEGVGDSPRSSGRQEWRGNEGRKGRRADWE